MKEHQKISVAATLHVALDNLSRLEAILEQPSDFHEIVCDDVPISRRTAIRDEVWGLRRIVKDMFDRFALFPKGGFPPAERCSVRDAYCEQLLRACDTVSGDIGKALGNGGARARDVLHSYRGTFEADYLRGRIKNSSPFADERTDLLCLVR